MKKNVKQNVPVGGVGGAHWYDRRSSHDLVESGSSVRKVVHVLQCGKPFGSDDSVKLLLDLLHDFRVVQHVDDGPEQGGLEGFNSGGEKVENDLFHLSFGVEAVEDVLVVLAVLGFPL